MCSTSLGEYPFLDVFSWSITPSWATLLSMPTLDMTRTKVSYGTHWQGAAAESKKSVVRENESHDEKVWSFCWREPKELSTEKTRGKKLSGEEIECRARNLLAMLFSRTLLALSDKLRYFCLLPSFFPLLFKDSITIITLQYLAALALTCMHRLGLI